MTHWTAISTDVSLSGQEIAAVEASMLGRNAHATHVKERLVQVFACEIKDATKMKGKYLT